MTTLARCTRWSAVAVVGLVVLGAGCKQSPSSRSAVARAGSTAQTAGEAAPPAAMPNRATEAAATGSAEAMTATERAIAKAAEGGRYAFVLFYRPGESGGEQMRSTFDQAKPALQAKAVFLTVDVGQGAETALMGKYRVDTAPLPLTLALAPNGAVAKAFTKPVDGDALRTAFVSQTTARVLKALQDGKLVALCVQGENTRHNDESMAAARELVADERVGGQAEVMRLDPGDRDEAPLLEQCNLSPTLEEASIVLLVPPGTLVAAVSGATTKAKLLSALQQGLSACGSGCGPSGCG